jgi:hypothetical protein
VETTAHEIIGYFDSFLEHFQGPLLQVLPDIFGIEHGLSLVSETLGMPKLWLIRVNLVSFVKV